MAPLSPTGSFYSSAATGGRIPERDFSAVELVRVGRGCSDPLPPELPAGGISRRRGGGAVRVSGACSAHAARSGAEFWVLLWAAVWGDNRGRNLWLLAGLFLVHPSSARGVDSRVSQERGGVLVPYLAWRDPILVPTARRRVLRACEGINVWRFASFQVEWFLF